MRVGLISCSKRKLGHAAPATDLYQGDLFKLSITAPNRIDTWAILSAKHGVVLPEQVSVKRDTLGSATTSATRPTPGRGKKVRVRKRAGRKSRR